MNQLSGRFEQDLAVHTTRGPRRLRMGWRWKLDSCTAYTSYLRVSQIVHSVIVWFYKKGYDLECVILELHIEGQSI